MENEGSLAKIFNCIFITAGGKVCDKQYNPNTVRAVKKKCSGLITKMVNFIGTVKQHMQNIFITMLVGEIFPAPCQH